MSQEQAQTTAKPDSEPTKPLPANATDIAAGRTAAPAPPNDSRNQLRVLDVQATHHVEGLRRVRPRTLTDAVGELVASLARLTVVSLFVITFLLQPFQIPSGSMEKTMLIGDFVLVNKQVFAPAGRWGWLLPYREPRHDSLVVFHYPVNPPELLVKRVIALPGDRLHLLDNHVFLDGRILNEPFALYRPAGRSSFRDRFPNLQEADPAVEAPWWIDLRSRMRDGELPVPAGRYFAMGDNRNNSQDSRFWGFVPRENIVGEPLLVYFSVDRSPDGSEHLRRDRVVQVLH